MHGGITQEEEDHCQHSAHPVRHEGPQHRSAAARHDLGGAASGRLPQPRPVPAAERLLQRRHRLRPQRLDVVDLPSNG